MFPIDHPNSKDTICNPRPLLSSLTAMVQRTRGDDRRVLLWNVEEALDGASRPTAMRAQHISNIFCLVYDSKNTKIFSAGNDDQVIIHDTITSVQL
ncbi:hypothetical protein J6590_073595 [Homalodisca vitripennis]|nr:hypothetical protein J6590_073595 [Homalodisca vitripennis]